MTTSKQRTAARRNIKSAAQAAKRKRTSRICPKRPGLLWARKVRRQRPGNVNSSDLMRCADFCIHAARVVAQKIATGEFDAHGAAYVLVEFQNAERVQFPGRVLDFSRKEPSPACRIEPKSCREKNIKIALFHDSLFLRDSDPCL